LKKAANEVRGMINFKGSHCLNEMGLHAVLLPVRQAGSHRDLEEIMDEIGTNLDYVTRDWGIVKYSL
jgi:hypothetical protein